MTSTLFQAGGAVATVKGAVRSIFTAGLLVALVVFAARSLTDAPAVRPVPSLVMVSFGGHAPSIPESASLHDQWIATSPLYQPLPFGLLVGAPASAGAVLSMLMADTVADWELPATSVAVPLAD